MRVPTPDHPASCIVWAPGFEPWSSDPRLDDQLTGFPRRSVRRLPSDRWELPGWLRTSRADGFAERPGWRFSLMLLLQAVFVFIAVPIFGTRGTGHEVIDLLQLATAAIAILLIATGPKWRLMLAATFAMTLLARLLPGSVPRLTTLAMVGASYVLVTAVMVRAVLGPGYVDQHRIAGAIAIYLEIALLFAIGFAALTELNPAAVTGLPPGGGHFEEILHLSLTTMTAIGDPAIAPVTPPAKALSDFETIVGQFFIAAFLARLVGLHLSSRK